ncbi:MAG: hypothetical protein WA182_21650 [Candidatus Sulfotelmatobacter sp.]
MNRSLVAIALLILIESAFAQNTAWDYSTKTDITGKVTETVASGSLVVRCSKACEVYFTPDRHTLVQDQDSVLVKFNDKPVKRYGVSRSADYTGLFFSDPMGILKAVRDNGGYMTVEYTPYQKIPDTVKYEVWNLPPTILKRIEKWDKEAPQRKRQAAWAACQADNSPLMDECGSFREEARSYHTKEACQSHGFYWREEATVQNGVTQEKGCWVKQ